MPNFKTCSNGHNYDAEKYTACPFCPGNNAEPDFQKTMTDFKNTQIFDDGNSAQFDKTVINDENIDFKKTLDRPAPAAHPFSRTTVVMEDNKNSPAPGQQIMNRKLVGWLVTFSHDEFGQDYKLYAGKNKIGSANNCDIIVPDSTISGEHATILFRDGEFLIKDHFSTNGTRINGETTDEARLKTDDEIKLGNTSFKFKTVF